jgi:hypothetical protein
MHELQRGNYQGAGENRKQHNGIIKEWGFQMDKVELDWQHTAMKKNTQRISAGKSPLWSCRHITNHPTSMVLKSEQDLS